LSLASEMLKIFYISLCDLLSDWTEMETNVRLNKMACIWHLAFLATICSVVLDWSHDVSVTLVSDVLDCLCIHH
jgi:hypothetical protein